MYMLRLISGVLHQDVGPAVSDEALDLRVGELAIVVPLVVLLLALSAWPDAISGHAFGAAPANAAIRSTLIEKAGGLNEFLAASPYNWQQGTGSASCREAGEEYLADHPDVRSATVILPCEAGGRVRLTISGAQGGGRGVSYSWSRT
jgi:hypothetical protein